MNLDNNSTNVISCEAKNCVHHSGQNNCTAPTIKVGTQFANSSAETVCSTFCPKS